MADLFPNGVAHYFLGGLLIGAGIAMIYLMTGRVAGISGILTAGQSWWSRRPVFHQARLLEERTWKGTFVLGLVGGAVLYALLNAEIFVTEVQWWRLLVGGVLVGFGTRRATGCTSGHGICGSAQVSPLSLASTATFMAIGIITARLVMQLGVSP